MKAVPEKSVLEILKSNSKLVKIYPKSLKTAKDLIFSKNAKFLHEFLHKYFAGISSEFPGHLFSEHLRTFPNGCLFPGD